MQRPNRDDAEPHSLARMMDLDEDAGTLWQPAELGDIFRHQLDAPVEFDLSYLGPAPGDTLRSVRASGAKPIGSFRDLFEHPQPPIELLEWTKKFARSCRTRHDGPLPDEIATVLYFLAIVTAMTRCNRRISRLDNASLRYGLAWAVRLPWIDAPSRKALEQGLKATEEPKT